MNLDNSISQQGSWDPGLATGETETSLHSMKQFWKLFTKENFDYSLIQGFLKEEIWCRR